MFSDTATRVRNHTKTHLNERIEKQWKERLEALRSDERQALINQRLEELDKEWDVERTLQTNFAALSLAGIGLAAKINKRWAALSVGVPAFMIQHALQGWCPPLAVLRRLGVRTAQEINEERFALQSLRGDFDSVESSRDTGMAYESAKDSGRPDRHQ